MVCISSNLRPDLPAVSRSLSKDSSGETWAEQEAPLNSLWPEMGDAVTRQFAVSLNCSHSFYFSFRQRCLECCQPRKLATISSADTTRAIMHLAEPR